MVLLVLNVLQYYNLTKKLSLKKIIEQIQLYLAISPKIALIICYFSPPEPSRHFSHIAFPKYPGYGEHIHTSK